MSSRYIVSKLVSGSDLGKFSNIFQEDLVSFKFVGLSFKKKVSLKKVFAIWVNLFLLILIYA